MGTFVNDVDIEHIDSIKRARHGLPWTPTEYAKLNELFERGESLYAVCELMQRPAAGVIAKLKGMNLITHNYATTGYDYSVLAPTIKPTTLTQENDMTNKSAPLNTITYLFGNDIKACSEADLISAISKCQNEITSFNNIPRNNWTAKRAVELNAAIDAAVAELDTRA